VAWQIGDGFRANDSEGWQQARDAITTQRLTVKLALLGVRFPEQAVHSTAGGAHGFNSHPAWMLHIPTVPTERVDPDTPPEAGNVPLRALMVGIGVGTTPGPLSLFRPSCSESTARSPVPGFWGLGPATHATSQTS